MKLIAWFPFSLFFLVCGWCQSAHVICQCSLISPPSCALIFRIPHLIPEPTFTVRLPLVKLNISWRRIIHKSLLNNLQGMAEEDVANLKYMNKNNKVYRQPGYVSFCLIPSSFYFSWIRLALSSESHLNPITAAITLKKRTISQKPPHQPCFSRPAALHASLKTFILIFESFSCWICWLLTIMLKMLLAAVFCWFCFTWLFAMRCFRAEAMWW